MCGFQGELKRGFNQKNRSIAVTLTGMSTSSGLHSQLASVMESLVLAAVAGLKRLTESAEPGRLDPTGQHMTVNYYVWNHDHNLYQIHETPVITLQDYWRRQILPNIKKNSKLNELRKYKVNWYKAEKSKKLTGQWNM